MVARYVLAGRPMADVGTDHAQLPLMLLRDGLVPSAVALDIAAGPFRIAQQASRGLEDRISVRRSDGLDELDENEVATICICGMGGTTMAEILRRGRAVWQKADRLVLQPQGMAEAVRKLMTSLAWDCVDGSIVEDRGKLFTVEVWESAAGMPEWSELDYRWGKRFRTLPDPLFYQQLQQELADIERVLHRMSESGVSGHPASVSAQQDRWTILNELQRIS